MKSRKTFLVMLILLAGCISTSSSAFEKLPHENSINTIDAFSRNKPVLGSKGYVDRITRIARLSGNKAALEAVMDDVDKNGHQIDTNDYETNLGLYMLVSRLVHDIGEVDMKTHFFRNKLNRAPKSLFDLLEQNSKLPPEKRWVMMEPRGSLYHMQGRYGIYNLKFVSPDSFCEAVYNMHGILLTEKNDPINMGTFNYGAGMHEASAHETYDIKPYLIWGNSEDSPQKGAGEISKAVDEVIFNLSQNEEKVMNYRKKLLNTYKTL